MSLTYVIVDVFTDTPLQGNQLAVFEDGSALSDDQMQRLAREMNYSETVFLLPAEDGGDARMRIFTPAAELAFAGHPVLGAAFVAAAARQLTSLQLETAAAAVPLKLTRFRQHGGSADDVGQITFAWMRQPIPAGRRSPGPHSCLPPSGFRNISRNPAVALGLDVTDLGRDIIRIDGTAEHVPGFPGADQVPEYVVKYDERIGAIFGTPTQFAALYSEALIITPHRLHA